MEHSLELILETPIIQLTDDRPVVEVSALGPQGPAGALDIDTLFPIVLDMVANNSSNVMWGDNFMSPADTGAQSLISLSYIDWSTKTWYFNANADTNTWGSSYQFGAPYIVSETQPVGTEGLLWVQPL